MEKKHKPIFVCFKVEWNTEGGWSPAPINVVSAISQVDWEKLAKDMKDGLKVSSYDLGFCRITADMSVGE